MISFRYALCPMLAPLNPKAIQLGHYALCSIMQLDSNVPHYFIRPILLRW